MHRTNLPGIVGRHDLPPHVLVSEQLGLFRHHVLLRACVCHLQENDFNIERTNTGILHASIV